MLQSAIGTWPRRGDRIFEMDGDTTFVYDLMSIGNEPPWRYSDPIPVKLCIHTKWVDTQDKTGTLPDDQGTVSIARISAATSAKAAAPKVESK